MSAYSISNTGDWTEDRDWLDRLLDRAPRLATLTLIAIAWAMTLAWPPTKNDRPLVEGGSSLPNFEIYPLRMSLPEVAGEVSLERLAELSATHPAIAALDLLPEPEVEAIVQVPAVVEQNVTQPLAPLSDSRNFASAFADFTSSLPASQRSDARAAAALAAAEGLAPGAFLNLNYDLATLAPSQPASGSSASANYNASDGSLTVTKALLVDGESKGRAAIRIEEGAQLYIATAAVADALGPRAQALPSRIVSALETGNGFIPFHELRGAGVAVEYDPVTDRVSLSMPS
uniref:hypothetical protein n=1 Tax=uncultured Altererythrobacter sp. TaxID=500840 RepID=UPI002612B5FD|nr:hypothetical protein [uncultured Altererythrobacter sp.]